MYPPRKTTQNTSKPKTINPLHSSQYPNYSHKDVNKVNKILQNAKKYQQAKDQKRDYMLQGIKNLKKKELDPEISNTKNKNGYKQYHGDGRESDRGYYDGRSKDKCRRIQRDEGDNNYQQLVQSQVNNIYSMDKQLKKVHSEGNMQNNNFYTFHQQQNYKIDSPKQIKSTFQTQHQRNNRQANQYRQNLNRQQIKLNPTLNTFDSKNSNTQHQIDNNRYSNPSIRQYNPTTSQSYSQKYASNIKDQQFTTQQKNDAPLYAISTESNYQQQAQQKKKESNIQFKSQRKNNNTNVNSVSNASSVKNKIQEQSPQFQNNQQYVQPLNNDKKLLQKTQKSSHLQVWQQKTQIIDKTNYKEKEGQGIKNGKDQQYIRKIEQGEMGIEQKNIIKQQMEKLSQQLNQMRNKFYKSEEEKKGLLQKLKVSQNQNNRLRAENQQNKLKLRNIQIEVNTLQNYKSITENQMKGLKSNKDVLCDDFMGKINELNIQLRKKSNEIVKLERNCFQMESQMNEKNSQLNRIRDSSKKKQQEITLLTSKQSQLNKLSSEQSKTEQELKICTDKNASLLSQNNAMKQKISMLPKLETELSKYRKQIQQMFEDMKDLQQQLSQKDRLLQQYKSYSQNSAKMQESTLVKLIKQQLELVMKQKTEQMSSYEQKLLEKDKQIEQIESQYIQQSKNSKLKLGGLQAGEAAFQQILKQQLQQINNLKKQNSVKIKELFTTKIQLQKMKCEVGNEANRNKILSLQLESGHINAQNLVQSHLRAAKNEVESLNRRIDSMNNVLESKKKEIQNKDEFIKQYLISTNKNNDIGFLLSQLQRTLDNKL